MFACGSCQKLEREIKWLDKWRSFKLLIIAVTLFYVEIENTESALQEIRLSLDDKALPKLQSILIFILEVVIWKCKTIDSRNIKAEACYFSTLSGTCDI